MQIDAGLRRVRPASLSGALGLDLFDTLVGTAASALTGGGGGGTGAAMPGVTTQVSPSFQVSPQISPVFQQQFQPENSGMSAGTSQALPTMAPVPPMPSDVPFGAGPAPLPVGYSAPGYASPPGVIPMPSVPEKSDWQKIVPWMIAGLGAFVLWKIYQRNQVKKTRSGNAI